MQSLKPTPLRRLEKLETTVSRIFELINDEVPYVDDWTRNGERKECKLPENSPQFPTEEDGDIVMQDSKTGQNLYYNNNRFTNIKYHGGSSGWNSGDTAYIAYWNMTTITRIQYRRWDSMSVWDLKITGTFAGLKVYDRTFILQFEHIYNILGTFIRHEIPNIVNCDPFKYRSARDKLVNYIFENTTEVYQSVPMTEELMHLAWETTGLPLYHEDYQNDLPEVVLALMPKINFYIALRISECLRTVTYDGPGTESDCPVMKCKRSEVHFYNDNAPGFMRPTLAWSNRHRVARNSSQADIEQNPGPPFSFSFNKNKNENVDKKPDKGKSKAFPFSVNNISSSSRAPVVAPGINPKDAPQKSQKQSRFKKPFHLPFFQIRTLKNIFLGPENRIELVEEFFWKYFKFTKLDSMVDAIYKFLFAMAGVFSWWCFALAWGTGFLFQFVSFIFFSFITMEFIIKTDWGWVAFRVLVWLVKFSKKLIRLLKRHKLVVYYVILWSIPFLLSKIFNYFAFWSLVGQEKRVVCRTLGFPFLFLTLGSFVLLSNRIPNREHRYIIKVPSITAMFCSLFWFVNYVPRSFSASYLRFTVFHLQWQFFNFGVLLVSYITTFIALHVFIWVLFNNAKRRYIFKKFYTLYFSPSVRGKFFSTSGPLPFLFKLEEYDDYFKLPEIPGDLLDQEKRIRWTLNEMEKHFGKQGEITPIRKQWEFFNNDPNVILPLKISSTSINQIYTTSFSSVSQSYPITNSKQAEKLQAEYAKALFDAEIDLAQDFAWTGNYYTPDRVIASTTRYGQEEFDFIDFNHDEMVATMFDQYKPMLKNSRLTSPRKIARNWKWNFSAGFGSLKNHRYQKRKTFLSQTGWSGITDFVMNILKNNDKMAAVPHVFPKMEYLPETKKFKIRSILGAPFFSYFTNQIFAYEPDHRFAYHSTPAQVGRPLTGFGLLPLFERYKKYKYVFGLDMSAFDSTFNKQVMDAVAALRIKGFENHAQFDKIQNLIKNSYNQNYQDPLFIGKLTDDLFGNGGIFEKCRGNATGAVSTSQTNCLALGIILAQLFHEASGMPYAEFFKRYDLANYGDDNILGVLHEEDKKYIYEIVDLCTKRYNGTIFLKIESEGLIYDCEFLSKGLVKLNEKDKKIYKDYFDADINYGIRHNRDKLIAKFDKFKKSKPQETDFIQKFAAFKLMSVHHEDLFDIIDQCFLTYCRENPTVINNPHFKIAASTYEQVLIKYYSPLDKHIAKVLATEFEEFSEDFEIKRTIWQEYTRFAKYIYNNISSLSLDFTTDIENGPFIKKLVNMYRYDIADYVAEIAKKSSWTADDAIKCLSRNNFRFIQGCDRVDGSPFHSWLDPVLSLFIFNINKINLKIHKKFPDPFANSLDAINRFNAVFSFFSTFFFNNVKDYVKFNTENHVQTLLFLSLIIARKYFICPFNYNIPFSFVDIEKMMFNFYNCAKTQLFPIETTDSSTVYGRVLGDLDLTKRLLFQAPTGWGKSTHFLVALQKLTKQKTIVIVPRAVLTKTIPVYLREQYPEMTFGIWSQGSKEINGDIIFSTPDSYLLRAKGHEYVIMDEAHIDEPGYNFIKKQKKKSTCFSLQPPHPTFLTSQSMRSKVPHHSTSKSNSVKHVMSIRTSPLLSIR